MQINSPMQVNNHLEMNVQFCLKDIRYDVAKYLNHRQILLLTNLTNLQTSIFKHF